jgi:outer membrane protein assembly factor BamB
MSDQTSSEVGEQNSGERNKEKLDCATIPLGEVSPTGSRHSRRSAVVVSDDLAIVGTDSGSVMAVEIESLESPKSHNPLDVRWSSVANDSSIVSLTAFAGGIVAGERGPAGEVRMHDPDTGEIRWQYATADDIGEPQARTRFALPFVVDCVTDTDRLYLAARRYERNNGSRDFTSIVYAFDANGDIAWQYRTDSSPISLAVRDDRVAIGYNRCTGDHQRGLVVLNTNTGAERWSWDPGTDGQRRVGDVSLLDDGVVVTSHGDHRGYRLDASGEVQWYADLSIPQTVNDEILYAYPNHTYATDAGIVFITGNTHPKEGRETTSLHPDEHTIFGYSMNGEREWTGSVGGFVNGIDADGTHVAVPCAQNFRTRNPETHALRIYNVQEGHRHSIRTQGVATAAALTDSVVAAVEEPVVYHDEDEQRGEYRLHISSMN